MPPRSALALAAALGLLLYVPTPHGLGAGLSALLGLVYLALIGLARPAPRAGAGLAAVGRILPFLAVLLAALGAVRELAALMRLPVDAEYADMLPLVREALASFWAGEPPYRVYRMPWPLPLTFLPLLWLGFLPAWLAGIDLRLLGLALGVLLLARLAGLAARPGGSAAALVLLLLATGTKFAQFARIGHLPLYWLLLVLLAEALVAGRRRALLWLGLLLATRQTAWLLLVPVALHQLELHGRRALAPLLGALLLGLVPIAVFFVQEPQAFLHGALLWYEQLGAEVYRFSPRQLHGQIGPGGLFYELGAAAALRWVRLGAVLLVVVATARSARRSAAGALHAAALLLGTFALLCAPCWWYSLLDPILLLVPAHAALGADGAARRALAVRRAAAAAAGLACVAWLGVERPHVERLDFGTNAAGRLLEGFERTERWRERTVCWALAPRARLALPRLWPAAGPLRLVLRPAGGQPVQIEVELNGTPLGSLHLTGAWSTHELALPRGLLLIGNNSLVLRGSAPERPGPDRRALLVALDELDLAPPRQGRIAPGPASGVH